MKPLARRIVCRLRRHASWFAHVAVAFACTAYLNARAELVPKWGQWYTADDCPYVLLQVRAFLSGRMPLVPHPSGAAHDTDWGRGGMHTNFGLGVPILATPFHIVGRLFGAPGFPDSVRFLILYAAVTVLLARALHQTSRRDPNSLVASMAATGFVMVFPAFVGLISTESQIYEQTIATGGLWSVLLLSGVLLLLHRCTAGRLVAVCAAAAFSTMIRPPLAIYGATTVALAMIIARRRGMGRGALIAGLASCAGVTALYLSGNALRFGSPFNAGFANIVSVTLVNRLTRWGLSFTKVPFTVAAKEMGLTLFSLETIGADAMRWRPPPSLARYTVGERWREYYSQTYDWFVLAVWIAALGIVCYRVVVGRLWRRDRTLGDETVTAVGLWALPPAIALFVFYARLPNMVTRYLTDMYPAFAAASLCVGMAIVDVVRTRAPARTPSAQMAIAGAVALYMAGDRGWVMHVSHPVDRDTIVSRIARVDARSADMPDVPQHFECGEPRGRSPMYMHLEGWGPDCSFPSGMVFAMRHSPCVSFTLSPGSGSWGAGENESLAGFRATGDFDALVRCGPPALDGDVRRVTMCDPGPPPFLLDGMRLYAIASLDADLNPLDRLKLVRIDAAQSCPAGP